MEVDWTEKYRPARLSDIAGNVRQLDVIRKWAKSWSEGVPKKRALVLDGPPGVGKTSAALALAGEMGWAVVELNASDTRNAHAIRDIAERGALFDTFNDDGTFVSSRMGGHKLIVIDEADNLFGMEDKGGSGAIMKVVRTTRQPVVLIVNDYYELTRRSPGIQYITERVRFSRLKKVSLVRVLESICSAEGIKATASALDLIADNAHGDLRSAVKDLMAFGMGMDTLTEEDLLALSYREKEESVFDLMALTFKGTDSRLMREKMFLVDETPETLLLWYDENLPRQYRRSEDRVRGYDALSRADIYLSRVYKRQNYALWGYANDMMSEGVMRAKAEKYPSYPRLEFPNWLRKMSRSKGNRALRRSACRKIGAYTHASSVLIEREFFDILKALLKRDTQLQIGMTKEMGFTPEELAFMIGKKPDSVHVKKIVEEAERLADSETIPSVFERYGDGESDGGVVSEEEPSKETTSQKSLFDF